MIFILPFFLSPFMKMRNSYFIVSATFPLYILNQFLPTACHQMGSELPSSCILNKHITNTFQEFAGQSVLYLFLPNICADGKVSIISKSGALADSASCSQTALSA